MPPEYSNVSLAFSFSWLAGTGSVRTRLENLKLQFIYRDGETYRYAQLAYHEGEK